MGQTSTDLTQFATKDDLKNLALKTDIPAKTDLSTYALKTDIPAKTDLSTYALKTDIPNISTTIDLSSTNKKIRLGGGNKLLVGNPPGGTDCFTAIAPYGGAGDLIQYANCADTHSYRYNNSGSWGTWKPVYQQTLLQSNTITNDLISSTTGNASVIRVSPTGAVTTSSTPAPIVSVATTSGKGPVTV